ncbi:MAG: hypothetical protein ACRDJM_00915 [Actinomycetota bacterium]
MRRIAAMTALLAAFAAAPAQAVDRLVSITVGPVRDAVETNYGGDGSITCSTDKVVVLFEVNLVNNTGAFDSISACTFRHVVFPSDCDLNTPREGVYCALETQSGVFTGVITKTFHPLRVIGAGSRDERNRKIWELNGTAPGAESPAA